MRLAVLGPGDEPRPLLRPLRLDVQEKPVAARLDRAGRGLNSFAKRKAIQPVFYENEDNGDRWLKFNMLQFAKKESDLARFFTKIRTMAIDD